MASDLDRLAAGKYISLTTFRRDGTPVATPVWVTREGDHLYVITQRSSGKVKRLGHTSRVTVAACDMRGKVSGEAVPGTAVLLDEDGTAAVNRRVAAKYRVMSALFGLQAKIRRAAPRDEVGIEITLG